MTDHDPIETAWKIHAAVVDWTGKVDAKASFCVAVESAAVAGIISISADGRGLSRLIGLAEIFRDLGFAFLAIAILSAITVVTPRIRRAKVREEAGRNFIYFGHLKEWDAVDLASGLRDLDLLPMLTRQIVTMSKIAWQKHRRVQLSMVLAVVGATCVVVSYWLA
ncbi:DUF5706 domain-containing protein [Amycolatopsis sp. NBC_01307]|uniref:Pycsar system effector family protein n=1 Tax=Amycolatopsis sp. NBC_01307 TaxID=2903561 RepID=UPI002E15F364|nr:DUF5706 domain-containing protein [Amycolatopsis sp. NBC_01307]